MSSATSAAFFLGGAQTPVALTLAAAQGVVIANPFWTYLKGAILPALLLVAAIPAVVYWLAPPEVKATPWAGTEARRRLAARGRPGWREGAVAATLLAAVALWVRFFVRSARDCLRVLASAGAAARRAWALLTPFPLAPATGGREGVAKRVPSREAGAARLNPPRPYPIAPPPLSRPPLKPAAAAGEQCASSRLPFPLSNASVALLGVVVLLAAGAVTWEELSGHRPAWDLLVWLSILFSMCSQLAQLGVIKWLR